MLKKPEKFSKFDDTKQGGVLVIDSGLGSLSLVKEIQKILPQTSITAVADNEEFPYGLKPEQEIIDRVLDLAKIFVPIVKPKTILIACNTASTVVLPILRDQFKIPVVGIVPAIKPAAEYSSSRKIALLATPGTVKRAYVDSLIKDFASDCEIIRVGTSGLVDLAERKALGEDVCSSLIAAELDSLIQHSNYSKVDSLILGCTHFSFLHQDIESLIFGGIRIFDPAGAVAQQVARVHVGSSASPVNTLIFTKEFSRTIIRFPLCVEEIFYL